MHVDDLAEACVHLIEHYEGADPINVGTGQDLSIRELAETMQRIVNPDSHLVSVSDKPDGTPRKMLDVSKINALGWKSTIDLEEGIAGVEKWLADRVRSGKVIRGWEEIHRAGLQQRRM